MFIEFDMCYLVRSLCDVVMLFGFLPVLVPCLMYLSYVLMSNQLYVNSVWFSFTKTVSCSVIIVFSCCRR